MVNMDNQYKCIYCHAPRMGCAAPSPYVRAVCANTGVMIWSEFGYNYAMQHDVDNSKHFSTIKRVLLAQQVLSQNHARRG